MLLAYKDVQEREGFPKGAHHLPELAGQVCQFVNRMCVYEYFFQQDHQNDACHLRIDRPDHPVLTNGKRPNLPTQSCLLSANR